MPMLSIVAVVLMMTVLCGGLLVLQRAAQEQRLDRHLELATSGSIGHDDNQQGQHSIRLRAALGNRRRNRLAALFGYDGDALGTSSIGRVVVLAVIAAAAVLILGRMILPLWALPGLAFAVAIFTTRTLFRSQRDRYADRLLRQLPDTIELIVSAVRTGLPIAESFRAVAREMPEPTREQFARVLDELAVGRPPHEAILSLHDRSKVPEYAIFAVTLAVQNRSGGALAETLQTLGDTVRERVSLAARAKALAGEAKLSAQVLAALPFAGGGMMLLSNRHALDPLFQDPRGKVLFVVGIVSLLLGIYTMRRMIKKGTTV